MLDWSLAIGLVLGVTVTTFYVVAELKIANTPNLGTAVALFLASVNTQIRPYVIT